MPNVDIDITDVRGQTPLFAAVKYNHVENIEIMCKAGANPNGSNIHSESPVHIAVRDGFYDVIEVLLKYGASPDGYDAGDRIKRENFGTIPVRRKPFFLCRKFLNLAKIAKVNILIFIALYCNNL